MPIFWPDTSLVLLLIIYIATFGCYFSSGCTDSRRLSLIGGWSAQAMKKRPSGLHDTALESVNLCFPKRLPPSPHTHTMCIALQMREPASWFNSPHSRAYFKGRPESLITEWGLAWMVPIYPKSPLKRQRARSALTLPTCTNFVNRVWGRRL